MDTRKQKQHNLIRACAAAAVRDLYHNATPSYPRDLYGRTEDYFQAWFNDLAQFEIEYLQDGGAYGSDYAKTLRAPCNAGKYTSEAARNYYVRKGMNAMHAEREDCGALTGWKVLELAACKAQGKSTGALWHRWFKGCAQIPARSETTRNNSLWECITDYGKLYTFGRGGRTLAPDELYSDRKQKFDAAEHSIGYCLDVIRIVESFNAHVSAWCDSVPDQWRENCEYEDAEALAQKRAASAAKAKETRERRYWEARDVCTVQS